MAIDFSFLEGVAPQKENTPTQTDTANITIRVDADSFLHCDSKFIDIQLKAGVITKTKLPIGQHLLEFISSEYPDIKVEKAVDFPVAGKNYLVLISELTEVVEAEEEAEAKRKAEEEAQRLAEEAAKKAEEEAKRKAEEEVKRKAEEAKRIAEEEAKRIAALREPYVALSNNNQTLTFYYDHLKSDRNGVKLEGRWNSYKTRNAITVVFDESFANFHDICSTSNWFYSFRELTSVIGLNNLDTSKVTDMSYMFSDCNSLEELDLSSFDTSKVTDMSSMFSGCDSLEELDLSSFNTRKVTDMGYMFCNCNNLEELDLSSFDTSKVTFMMCMFRGCSGLRKLDLSSFNTKNVTNMRGMFLYCLLDFPENQFNKEEVLDFSVL